MRTQRNILKASLLLAAIGILTVLASCQPGGLVFDPQTGQWVSPLSTSPLPTPTLTATSLSLSILATPTIQPSFTPTPTPCPASLVPTGYIGCQYPPLPDGFIVTKGWLFSDYQTSPRVYGFEVISDTLRMLWLDKFIGNGTPGELRRWEVKAVLILPELSESETFAYECRIDGVVKTDPEIFAVAEVKDSLYLDNVKQAWRANRYTSAFEPIKTTGIVCLVSPLEYWR